MSSVRKTLYDRLPEIYRIKDAEQNPPYQLQAYLAVLDEVQAAIHDNIEALYHDFFIETCDDWVIPYIADLLGSSHLSGDPWTLRADVARTVRHRRRKGTLGAIESLTYALSGWAVHTVELRKNIAWCQHLNHQRPDRGGEPPIPLLIAEQNNIGGAVRGGTVTLRNPALLSFFNGPFDPFAHTADFKPPVTGAIRYNLPNLAIFLWRLHDYTVPVTRPVLYDADGVQFKNTTPAAAPADPKIYGLRYDLHPLAEPMVLFNTHRYQADDEPPNLTHPDAVPGPMPAARLNADAPGGNPEAYIALDFYSGSKPDDPGDDAVGLTLHLSDAFDGHDWTFRGANLCAWDEGLNPPLVEYEIVVDPERGRLLIGVAGVNTVDEAEPLHESLYISATHGFSGTGDDSSGAQPVVRDQLDGAVEIDYQTGPGGVPAAGGSGLQLALNDASTAGTEALIIQINDSQTYSLDIQAVTGADDDDNGLWVLNLGRSLIIRAASGQRPVILLSRPLGFRPVDVTDAGVADLDVTLEGLYISWDHASGVYPADAPLINRAAVNRLNIVNCTLDPGSYLALNEVRQPARYAFNLTNDYGFADGDEEEDFEQTPQIVLERSICGPVAIDSDYDLTLTGTIVDAASGVGDTPANLAVHAASGDAETEWGPALNVDGMTCFGRMRVESATGAGGIWLHRLEVHDDQQGCIKFSYFSGDADKLPQHQACVFGTQAAIRFTSEVFGTAGYAQLHFYSDRRILEQGPNHDIMGAFGYLLNTHRWKNINIRYREFMPVGVRPVLVPVT